MSVAEGIELSRDGVVRWRAPQLDAGAEESAPAANSSPAPVAPVAAPAAPAPAGASASDGMLTAGQVDVWEAEAREEGLKQGLEEGRKDGFAEGFEKGLAEGRAEGKREQQLQIELLKKVAEQMTAPLHGMEEELHRELLTLAVAMAQQLVRREIQVDPGEIIPVITESLALLPSHARDVVVHVHPEDAALIRELLADATDDADWSISEDPLLTRGGCRVESQNSSIDASLETRLAGLMATHLSGRRHGD
ncbi:MAG: flagellar assembly protein FliH [Granulosicoccaceae bacterium]